MKAENRHYNKVHKKKAHPAAKCSNKKCLICHTNKILKVPNRQQLIEKSKNKPHLN